MLFRLRTHFYKLNTSDEVENAENWYTIKWVRNGFKILNENKTLKDLVS